MILTPQRISELVDRIKTELKRQDIKFPNQSHTIFKWLCIITEEVGEIHKEALELPLSDYDFIKFRNEIMQTITLLVRLYFTPYNIDIHTGIIKF